MLLDYLLVIDYMLYIRVVLSSIIKIMLYHFLSINWYRMWYMSHVLWYISNVLSSSLPLSPLITFTTGSSKPNTSNEATNQFNYSPLTRGPSCLMFVSWSLHSFHAAHQVLVRLFTEYGSKQSKNQSKG